MKLLMTMLNAKDFTPLAENEYDETTFRTDERGYFQTQIYFKNYIPAFSIEDAAGGDYSLEFSADEDGTDRQKFQRHSNFYYADSLGWNVVGWTYIFILENGAVIETHRLLILPDRKECEAMIRELLSIRRELFQKSNENKSSLAENLREKTWAEILQTLNEQSEEIFRLMKRINSRPRFCLQKFHQNCNVSKIRRFDDKIIRQYVISPNRKKYSVSAEKISMNIFENRLLKNKILRLKEFVEIQTQQQKIKISSTESNIQSQIDYVKGLAAKDKKQDDQILKNKNLESLEAQLDYNKKNFAISSDEIIEKLNKCLDLKIFQETENKDEKWRMTQIFTNDANYRKAYLKLKELDEIFDFSFDADEKSFPAEKMYQIYEWWVLAKIVEFLIVKLHWKSEDNTPAEILRKLFNNLENIQSTKISLIHENSKMKMEIFYNTEINESMRTTNCKLRPDYLFKVTANNATKFFILDAKYRNYEQQGLKFWQEKDLKGVCFEKYIEKIASVSNKEISMSFIVHSDTTPNDNSTFLGKYVVYNGTIAFKNLFPTINGQLQQIGSFYLLPEIENDSKPNQSEINLSLFFKMMFEYFMNQWKICWECGSSDVEINEFNPGRYEKYHLGCKKCGAFWVNNYCSHCSTRTTLIKHVVNYHIEQIEDYRWLVHCPKCGG